MEVVARARVSESKSVALLLVAERVDGVGCLLLETSLLLSELRRLLWYAVLEVSVHAVVVPAVPQHGTDSAARLIFHGYRRAYFK